MYIANQLTVSYTKIATSLLLTEAGQLDTLISGQNWTDSGGADEARDKILPYDARTTSCKKEQDIVQKNRSTERLAIEQRFSKFGVND